MRQIVVFDEVSGTVFKLSQIVESANVLAVPKHISEAEIALNRGCLPRIAGPAKKVCILIDKIASQYAGIVTGDPVMLKTWLAMKDQLSYCADPLPQLEINQPFAGQKPLAKTVRQK